MVKLPPKPPSGRPPTLDEIYGVALALHQGGRFADAQKLYARVLAERPAHAGALHGTGVLALNAGQLAEAEKLLARAVAESPREASYHAKLAMVLSRLGRYRDALASADRSSALDPKLTEAWEVRAQILFAIGENEQALESAKRAAALAPGRADLRLAALKLKTFVSGSDPRDMAGDAVAVAASLAPRSQAVPTRTDPDADRIIRLGFVSADLRGHPVGRFLLGLVSAMDPSRFELHAFSSTAGRDATTEDLRAAFTFWHDVAMLSDDALVQRIRDNKIDVLVDLSGYTDGHRLAVFARKPAPVAFTWLGYFATTGLRTIDYVLANRHVVPDGELDQWAEMAWHMPDTYLCYTVPSDAPLVSSLPALAGGAVTFGSFNNFNKISSGTIRSWVALLNAVPRSRLILRSSSKVAPEFTATLRGRFEKEGLAPDRLRIDHVLADYAAHLRSYAEIDIALDPFPYNGGTTTVEALYMGVPVLVRTGDRYVAHMGESILHNAGLPQWIATDEADYVVRGARLASDLEALAALRAGLRERMLASPLFDAPRFARNFEDAVHGMWAKWCAAQRRA